MSGPLSYIIFFVGSCQVKDQQEAEKRKVTSQEIQEQLAVQTEHIKEKKKLVLEDLSKVEPAVKDAQQGQCSMQLYTV